MDLKTIRITQLEGTGITTGQYAVGDVVKTVANGNDWVEIPDDRGGTFLLLEKWYVDY